VFTFYQDKAKIRLNSILILKITPMFKESESKHSEESKTIIGSSVNVEGDFKGKGDVLIEGKLKGSVKTDQDVTIGEHAVVNAEVEANNAYIAGKVHGNVVIKDKLELTKTAEIKGNISASTLSIEAGARFNGQANMDGKPEEVNPKEKSSEK